MLARSGFGAGLLRMGGQAPEQARYQMVSANFFSVLGVRAAAGRLFESSDTQEGGGGWPVVLRYGYALRHFGTVDVAGRHAVLNGVPVTIAGVTAKPFLGVVTGYAPDIWLPLEAQSTGEFGAWFDSLGPGHGIDLDKPWAGQAGIFWLWVTARVPMGQRAAMAARWTAALQPDLALMAGAAPNEPAKDAILHTRVKLVSVARGEGQWREDSGPPLMLLMALAGAVFLAGCLNLANLQAARLSAREAEFRVRASLGASRWQLLRQVLVEDALLTAMGGALALATGQAASAVLLRWASSRDWRLDVNLHMSAPVAVLGMGMMAAALCVFSLVPAWRVTSGRRLAAGSQRGQAASGQSRAARRGSSAMLAAQVSLSLLLVAMAGCFARTLIHFSEMNTGMDREHVLSVHVDMMHGYPYKRGNLPEVYRMLVERLDALPGVRSTAVEMCEVPDCGWNTKVHAFGKPEESAADVRGEEDHVGPGYFGSMGIALLRGRAFADTDRADTQKVAVLNEAYAKKLFGGENPVGHWIGHQAAPNDHEFLIVGEVADAHVDGPQWPAPPMVYLSIDQNPAPINSVEVRTEGTAAAMMGEIRRAMREIDPQLPVTEIVPLNAELDDVLSTQKLLARLSGMLAGLTLALAALGFYGVVAYRVARRRNEIGIRMALGATRASVRGLVLRQTGMILLAGIVPGLILTELAAHAARSLLYGSAGANWPVLAMAMAALMSAGLAGTLGPARRAAGVDPMEALRAE